MTDVALWLQKKKELPPLTVVFTVDDGYRDFYENAFPVLSAYSIPATVYLATDMLDTGQCLWVDWVRLLYEASPLPQANPQQAAFETKERLKLLPNAERLAFLRDLPGKLQVASPPPLPARMAPLTWDEVRIMAKKGIEFGAHTMSHPVLSRVSEPAELQHELAGSKARIESKTGQPVYNFCYPNGTFRDFNEQTVAAVRECGYLTAVTGEKGVNLQNADPYRLRRIQQEPTIPVSQYSHQVAGLSR